LHPVKSRIDAGARIALEVTHKVGKLVDIRERSSCYFINFSEKIIQAHNILFDVEFLGLCCESVKIHGVVENIFCIASFEVFLEIVVHHDSVVIRTR
jgi:hypothetical protein